MKKKYLLLGIIFLIISLLLVWFYRPFVYKNNINDFGLADALGSLFAVIVSCFIIWGTSKKTYSNSEKNKLIILATFTYSVFYELLGVFHIWGTADIKDSIASVISGVITFYAKNTIERKITFK